jgi:hypothetical protein
MESLKIGDDKNRQKMPKFRSHFILGKNTFDEFFFQIPASLHIKQ